MTGPGKRTILILIISFTGIVFSFKAPRVPEAAAQEVKEADNKIEYKSESLRDPFQPEEAETTEPQVQAEPQPLPPLQVQGMVWGGSLPQAIINNKVVKIGDTPIEGVRITAIDKGGVTVLFEKQLHLLSIPVTKSWDDL
ncbi:MAG: hypothetical protein ABIH75_01095 [Candidatus Omnitrophota bacterium]